MAHDAVKAADAAGKSTNALTIAVGGDRVRFLVNGTEVYSHAAGELDVAGVSGLRVNHNLDVTVEGFSVSRG